MEILNIDKLRQDKTINDIVKVMDVSIISDTLINISREIFALYMYVENRSQDCGDGFFRDRIETLAKLMPEHLIFLNEVLGCAFTHLDAYQDTIEQTCNNTYFTKENRQAAQHEIDTIVDKDIFNNSIVNQMQKLIKEQITSIRNGKGLD